MKININQTSIPASSSTSKNPTHLAAVGLHMVAGEGFEPTTFGL